MPVTMSKFIDTQRPVRPIIVSDRPPSTLANGSRKISPMITASVESSITDVNVVCTVFWRVSSPGLSNENRNIAFVSPSRNTMAASVIVDMISSTSPNWIRETCRK